MLSYIGVTDTGTVVPQDSKNIALAQYFLRKDSRILVSVATVDHASDACKKVKGKGFPILDTERWARS